MESKFDSIVSALQRHAKLNPESKAYALLDEHHQECDSLTFAELERRARILAMRLATISRPGDRALLLFFTDLSFIISFFACQIAGVIAVPMKLTGRRSHLPESSTSIISDCSPSVVLTNSSLLEDARCVLSASPAAKGVQWLCVDGTDWASPSVNEDLAPPPPEALAFLQYTSGSTSLPKGVMVSHKNLSSNLEMISDVNELSNRSTRVSWIPLFHDMGLIFGALQATYVGALCVLMDPSYFIRRPLAWLKAIHAYQAEMAIAPNFAFDICCDWYAEEKMAGVDLSCWKMALNGSEPVRAATLLRFSEVFGRHGFSACAFHPTYGMAEATLMISGGRLDSDGARLWRVDRKKFKAKMAVSCEANGESQFLVGCGKSLPGERIAIVDPKTNERLGSGCVGEIWVNGPHVAQGYWKKPTATKETFQAEIAGEESGVWLRTGDLGCLDDSGELYITGRMKDVIIIRGSNYYPQDIELAAERSHPAIRPSYGAAFTVSRNGVELLVIVYEIRMNYARDGDVSEIVDAIRSAVIQEHGLTVHHVTLTPPRSIPKTTSGKVRRAAARELWLKGRFASLNRSDVYEKLAGEPSMLCSGR